MDATGATASFVSVPPKAAAAAILEAAAAGVPFVVCITEGIPAQDEALVFNTLKRDYPGTRLLGPNCPGHHQPGHVQHRHHGRRDRPAAGRGPAVGRHRQPLGHPHLPGPVRAEAARASASSTCVGLGGDPVPGTSFIDCLAAFQADPETAAVIMIGEIGGSAEEEAAEFIRPTMTKPVVAYIAGVTAPAGKKMGHAGAIVSGGKGTAQGKMDALRAAGAQVGLNPTEAGELMVEIVKGL